VIIALFSQPVNRATFRVFKIERKLYGREDLEFLERVFQKLLLNFTWWAINFMFSPLPLVQFIKVG
jgi:hypothetical protein